MQTTEQLLKRLEAMEGWMKSHGWQQFDWYQLDDTTVAVTADDFPSSDAREARNELYDTCSAYLGRHGWKLTQLPDGSHEVIVSAAEVILPVMTDKPAPEPTQDSDETAETMNELRRKFAGVKWDLLALGAYIAHNIEIDELRDVITSNDQQTTADHLRNIIAAEFGVDQAQVSDMNAELINSIGAGGVNVVRWSKDQYLNWMKGVHLATIDYSLLLRLLFDIENEETDSQTRIHDKPE
jgi:hypothetical protein